MQKLFHSKAKQKRGLFEKRVPFQIVGELESNQSEFEQRDWGRLRAQNTQTVAAKLAKNIQIDRKHFGRESNPFGINSNG